MSERFQRELDHAPYTLERQSLREPYIYIDLKHYKIPRPYAPLNFDVIVQTVS